MKGFTQRSIGLSMLVFTALLWNAMPAQADTFGFGCITNTNPVNCATGVSQLSVDVTANGSGVDFTFHNAVGNPSSITDVYFDDGTLLGIASISSSGGVNFSQGATPSNLPGGNNASPPFNTSIPTENFSADSNPAAAPNGVNSAGEFLTLTFNLQSGKTFADTIAALNDGSLRIGLHIQAFAGEGSESFVNTVPEPSTTLLLGLGLVGAALVSIRKFQAKG